MPSRLTSSIFIICNTFLALCLLGGCSSASQTSQTPKDVIFAFDHKERGELTVFELSATQQLGPFAKKSPYTRKQIDRLLNKQLEQKLLQTNLCDNGYRELSRSIGNNFAIIRGECI